MRKKKWGGPKRQRSRRLQVDSYSADVDDLARLRDISKRTGVSKAELLRLGAKLVIYSYEWSARCESA